MDNTFSSEVQEGTTQKDLYDTIIRLLSNGHAVVYAVEGDVNKTVVKISKIETAAEDYIESGALKIINPDSFYSASKRGIDCDKLIAQWQTVVSSMQSKGYKSILVVGMPARNLFAESKSQLKIVETEACIAKMQGVNIRIFCCYPKSMVDKLPFRYLVRLLNSHQDFTSNAGPSQVLLSTGGSSQLDVMSLIESSLTTVLGGETCRLVLKTMKLVYKLDQKDIVGSPELFEEKVRKLFGMSGDAILKMLTSTIVEMIAGDQAPI
ncbi:MAG: MEDS domain-containing protein [Nitrososphaera sp.]